MIIVRSGLWLDAMTLQKLLYYVQAWHLAITDEPLFEDRFKAWRDGPVVPEVWHARKEQSSRRARNQAVDEIQLSVDTLDLIDLVLATYGSMSGDELSALTHVEAPWLEARGDLPPDAHGAGPISTETMARFYRSHRRLGGRTAADLAAAGVHLASPATAGPVSVDEILDSLGDALSDPGDDAWGGANLASALDYNADGIRKERRRAHAGA
ncbi:Panacea domain-containing protein [Dactylosporangium sp. CA-233914]|uniref:Panacea domain-containing protein n=1 Tax=Dactylosporangium sp. CA-233914 TaxID=3239934 RepID=UPI003D8E8B36